MAECSGVEARARSIPNMATAPRTCSRTPRWSVFGRRQQSRGAGHIQHIAQRIYTEEGNGAPLAKGRR